VKKLHSYRCVFVLESVDRPFENQKSGVSASYLSHYPARQACPTSELDRKGVDRTSSRSLTLENLVQIAQILYDENASVCTVLIPGSVFFTPFNPSKINADDRNLSLKQGVYQSI